MKNYKKLPGIITLILTLIIVLACFDEGDCTHDSRAWHTAKAETCTADGIKELRCAKCGEVVDTDPIPAKHKWGSPEEITPAACETDGEEKAACTVCDADKVSPIPKPGHNMGNWSLTTSATIVLEGEETGICSRCGHIETRPVVSIPIINKEQFIIALNTIITAGSGSSGNIKNYSLNIQGNIDGITPAVDNDAAQFGVLSYISVTLKGSGTLNTANANGSMFRLLNGQTLILNSENLILQGRRAGTFHTSDNNSPVIFVDGGATFNLIQGIIKGNTNNSPNGSGGVYISFDGTNRGTFIKTGGKIYGNENAVLEADRNRSTATNMHVVGFQSDVSSFFHRAVTLGETDNISTESALPDTAGVTLNNWTRN